MILESGKDAFTRGEPLINNPHLRYSSAWDKWNEEWRDAWWNNYKSLEKRFSD